MANNKMKVYIVVKDNWNFDNISIFSTKEKAKNFIKKCKYNTDSINIIEYELDSEEEI